MVWWVIVGIVIVAGVALAWWTSGRAKKGLASDATSASYEHERFQRGTDGRSGT